MNQSFTTGTLADALREMALAEIEEGRAVPALRRVLCALTPHLDDRKRSLWFYELKTALQRAGRDGGGADWADRAEGALETLTGAS